ncbi:hypothetical protein [Modicisalibacter radicis]|uniref:hypothetical protein n=1 Tax=Halomonas sp. EAR18 TaxID=2518972 RepID=UPI00109C6DFF|nr:hypothetical protein [Halomonas sp. EAR18]
MKSKLLLGALISTLALSGCATIVGDRDETVTLNSSPSDANIVITDERGNEILSATTPTTTQLKKADGSYFGGKTYSVEISKEGYDSRKLTIESTPNGWYIAGNIVFGGLIGWLVVDPLTGAMYNLSPSEINASLDESVARAEDGGKVLNIVLLEDLPSHLQSELVLIGKA